MLESGVNTSFPQIFTELASIRIDIDAWLESEVRMARIFKGEPELVLENPPPSAGTTIRKNCAASPRSKRVNNLRKSDFVTEFLR